MKKKSNTPSADALKQFDSLPDAAGVRLPLACALLGCSPATIWRLSKAGKIQSIKISSRVTAFNVGTIRKFLGGALCIWALDTATYKMPESAVVKEVDDE